MAEQTPKSGISWIGAGLILCAGILIGFLAGAQSGKLEEVALADEGSSAVKTWEPDPEAPTSTHNFEASMARAAKVIKDPHNSYKRMGELIAFADAIPSTGFEASLDRIRANQKGHSQYEMMTAVYEKWAGRDPEAAMNSALEQTGSYAESYRRNIAAQWAGKDPAEALSWLEAQDDDSLASQVGSNMLRAMARVDPEGALQTAKGSLFPRQQYSGTVSSIMSVWAEIDPAAAAGRAAQLESKQDRENAFRQIASRWASEDPDATWKWALSLPDSKSKAEAQKSVVIAIGQSDSEEAIRLAHSMPEGSEREGALSQVMNDLSRESPEEAYHLAMNALGPATRNRTLSVILRNWARIDPERAFTVAHEEMELGAARNNALSGLISQVGTHDTDKAMALLDRIKDPAAYQTALRNVANLLRGEDIEYSLNWIETLPEGRGRQSARSGVIRRWAEEDPEKAATWVLDTVDEKDTMKESDIRNILYNWASDDAADAITWVLSNLESEESQDKVLPSLLRQWSNQDIDAAATWTVQLPEGKLKEDSYSSLISSWVNFDPSGAAKWLNSVQVGKARDKAIAQFSSNIAKIDPKSALTWAGEISDQQGSSDAVQQVARIWKGYDPTSASQWIRSSNLPTEVKEKLLK
tara:strand:+ start:1441 stop:3360 length:1920 start_codon:yes stop_codon:yes gene_type:complete